MSDFNQMQRQRLAAKNQAMPDGSFPIRNVADLKRAIQAYGRAKNKAAAKAWIIKRAKQNGVSVVFRIKMADSLLLERNVISIRL